MKRWIINLMGAAFLLLFSHERVWAYFDPGTGSMMLQVIFGVLIGFFIMVRQRIIAIVKRIFSKRLDSEKDGT